MMLKEDIRMAVVDDSQGVLSLREKYRLCERVNASEH